MSQHPRSRRRDETHRRIFEAGMRLFRERGFDKVSVGEIAAAAEVSVPTFYAHYASKEHLVVPVPQPGAVAAVYARQPSDASVTDRVLDAMRTWFAMIEGGAREDELERWKVVAATPALRIRIAEFERRAAGTVVELLTAAPPPETSPLSIELTVNLLLPVYTQVVIRWAEEDGTRSLELVAEEVFAVLRSLGGPPVPLSPSS